MNAGESVQLNCHVPKGDKPVKIEWHFDGGDIKSTALAIVTVPFGDKAILLSVNAVGPEHSGNFTCIAKNAAGITNYTAELQVNGWPPSKDIPVVDSSCGCPSSALLLRLPVFFPFYLVVPLPSPLPRPPPASSFAFSRGSSEHVPPVSVPFFSFRI